MIASLASSTLPHQQQQLQPQWQQQQQRQPPLDLGALQPLLASLGTLPLPLPPGGAVTAATLGAPTPATLSSTPAGLGTGTQLMGLALGGPSSTATPAASLPSAPVPTPPLAPGSAATAPSAAITSNRSLYRDKLLAIYKVHKPDNVEKVDYLLDKYAGKEEFLYQSVCSKYRIHPDAWLGPCTAPMEAATDPASAPAVLATAAATTPAAIPASAPAVFPAAEATPAPTAVEVPTEEQAHRTNDGPDVPPQPGATAADISNDASVAVPQSGSTAAVASAVANVAAEDPEDDDEYDPFGEAFLGRHLQGARSAVEAVHGAQSSNVAHGAAQTPLSELAEIDLLLIGERTGFFEDSDDEEPSVADGGIAAAGSSMEQQKLPGATQSSTSNVIAPPKAMEARNDTATAADGSDTEPEDHEITKALAGHMTAGRPPESTTEEQQTAADALLQSQLLGSLASDGQGPREAVPGQESASSSPEVGESQAGAGPRLPAGGSGPPREAAADAAAAAAAASATGAGELAASASAASSSVVKVAPAASASSSDEDSEESSVVRTPKLEEAGSSDDEQGSSDDEQGSNSSSAARLDQQPQTGQTVFARSSQDGNVGRQGSRAHATLEASTSAAATSAASQVAGGRALQQQKQRTVAAASFSAAAETPVLEQQLRSSVSVKAAATASITTKAAQSASDPRLPPITGASARPARSTASKSGSGGEKQADKSLEKFPQGMTRDQVVRAIFRALDSSFTGRVAGDSMRRFATLNGFEGTDEEWREEHSSLCSQWQVSPSEGFSEEVFTQLVNDQTERGCYCSNQELWDLFKKVVPPAGPMDDTPPHSGRTSGGGGGDRKRRRTQ